MTIPAVAILWTALGIFAVITIIAATHVVFGIRFANRDRHILVATLTFLLAFVIITGVGAIMVRNVDWGTGWTVTTPTPSSGGAL